MINPDFDPSAHQVVVCDGCGKEIPLKPFQGTDWSIYSVSCPLRCGRFGIVSKFRMSSGAACPLCGQKIRVLKRHPYTEQMVTLLRGRGLQLYRFVEHGGVEPI